MRCVNCGNILIEKNEKHIGLCNDCTKNIKK
jgi:hypothetical protein